MLARLVATYRPTGVEVGQTIWIAVRYRDGMGATWWQWFRTEAEALEAAGLSE